MTDSRILVCDECKTMVMLLNRGDGELCCDKKPMRALTANTTDAAQEKHVPAVTVNGNEVTVQVGSTAHPMMAEHYIQWIYLQTKNGGQYRRLTPNDKPAAVFLVADGDTPVAVYEYCNLHGLWKADI